MAEPGHERVIPIRDNRYAHREDRASHIRTKKPRTRGDVHASEDSQEAGPSHVAKGKRRAEAEVEEEPAVVWENAVFRTPGAFKCDLRPRSEEAARVVREAVEFA